MKKQITNFSLGTGEYMINGVRYIVCGKFEDFNIKKLFKLLIDRDMKKKELAEKAGISIATITKMGKDGAVVSSEVLIKICSALGCTMDDIVEIIEK